MIGELLVSDTMVNLDMLINKGFHFNVLRTNVILTDTENSKKGEPNAIVQHGT